jgi:uncharacterized membrane protein YkoI
MRLRTTLALCAALSLAAGSLAAQEGSGPKRNVPDSLVSKAKVSEDSAQGIALKRVPGDVEAVRLHSKNGTLEWTFGIKPKGKSHTENVTVSAKTGHVLSVSAAGSAKPKSSTTQH